MADRAALAAAVRRVLSAARGGDADAFGALVIKDSEGQPIDLHALHRVMTRFTYWCWARGLYAGVLAPLRHGKSTVGTIRLAAHEIGRNPNVRITVVCADDRQAILFVAAVRRYLTSPEYALVYPGVTPAADADWNKHQLVVSRTSRGPDPTLAAASVMSFQAGGGNDLLLFDDVAIYQNMVQKPAMREQIYANLSSVWLRRIVPTSRVLAVGTRWHADDVYARWMAQPGWRWLTIRVNADQTGYACSVT